MHDNLDFELTYKVQGDSSQNLEYIIATHERVFRAGEFESELGSWTIDPG